MPLSKKTLVDRNKVTRSQQAGSSRTKLACDRCRKKKSRCDGRQRCGPCTTYDAKCVFSSRPKREVRICGFCEMQELVEEALQRLYTACTRANVFPGTPPVVQGGRVTTDSILMGLGLDLDEHRYATQSSLCTRKGICQKNQQIMVFEESMEEGFLRPQNAMVKVEPHTVTAFDVPSLPGLSSPSDHTRFSGSEILSDGSPTHTAGINSVFSSPTEPDNRVNWHNVEAPHTKQWRNELHQYHALPASIHDTLQPTNKLSDHIPSRDAEPDRRFTSHMQHSQLPSHYQANQTYHYENIYMPPGTVQYHIQPPAMFMAPVTYAHGVYTDCYHNTIMTTNTGA